MKIDTGENLKKGAIVPAESGATVTHMKQRNKDFKKSCCFLNRRFNNFVTNIPEPYYPN